MSAPSAAATSHLPAFQDLHWPEGTVRAPFEDLDGVTLVKATLTGIDGRDTSGVFVLDSGAGYVAVDESLSILLGLSPGPKTGAVDFTRSPLSRFRLAELEAQQVQAMSFDAEVVRTVTDRPVLGLIGQQPMNDRVLWIDYQAEQLALLPAGPPIARAEATAASLADSRRLLAGLISEGAIALPFRIAAGGKVLVRARVTPRRGPATDWQTFVFDTGAS